MTTGPTSRPAVATFAAWILVILASCTTGPRGRDVRGAPPLVDSPVAVPGGTSADYGRAEGRGLLPARSRADAPEFVLETSNGDLYALAEQRGRWVVVHLFPRVDTPDCACDMTAFTDHLWRFGRLEVEVVGITSLPRERAARYAKKYAITAPILCDKDLAVTRALGAFDPGRVDPVVRTTVLVDPEGRVARRWDDVGDPDHIESVLRALPAE